MGGALSRLALDSKIFGKGRHRMPFATLGGRKKHAAKFIPIPRILFRRYIEKNGLNMPADSAASEKEPDPRCLLEPLQCLDISATGIAAVIWATGYAFGYWKCRLPGFAGSASPP
jgi:hypothetical protein